MFNGPVGCKVLLKHDEVPAAGNYCLFVVSIYFACFGS